MATKSPPSGYTGMQILLHWLIAILILFQLIFGESIEDAWRAYSRGQEPSADAMFSANIHVYIGISVLVLAVLRLVLRIRNGAPPLPENESALQKRIASATHLILYLLIFAVPMSGMAAWFGGVAAAGEVHHLAKPVIIVFVVLHAAAALWHHFIAKTDVLVRMLRPAR